MKDTKLKEKLNKIKFQLKVLKLAKDDKIDTCYILNHSENFDTIKAIEISEGSFLDKI